MSERKKKIKKFIEKEFERKGHVSFSEIVEKFSRGKEYEYLNDIDELAGIVKELKKEGFIEEDDKKMSNKEEYFEGKDKEFEVETTDILKNASWLSSGLELLEKKVEDKKFVRIMNRLAEDIMFERKTPEKVFDKFNKLFSEINWRVIQKKVKGDKSE